ncbi:MAG: hypothetical protein J0H98_10735 [Solirubrobacterales bacterium]|nr:hypothetical protein [Solirubrobacterales bacterium]
MPKPVNVSIVNAACPDPMGSSYTPPTPDRPYWIDPTGERVSVRDVWNGADDDTQLLVFDKTMDCINQAYREGQRRAVENGKIFRGAGVEHLLAELRSQLGPAHWKNR